MAVGGLPSKRQGRLGRPKDHRRPPAMDFTSSCRLSLFSSPSSLSTFFFSPFSLSFSFPRLLPLLLPRPLPRQLPLLVPSPSPSPSPPSPAPSPSPSPPPPTPSPTPSPSQSPFPLLVTTSCETSTVSGFSEPPHGTRLDTRLPVQGLAILAFPPWPRHRPPPVFFKTNPERLGPQ